MTTTRRCDTCGLTQFEADVCRRCGARLVEPKLTRPRPSRGRIRHFLGIWTSPRLTISSLVATDPTRGVLVISWFAGLAFFLDRMMANVDDRFPAGAVIVVAVAVGPLLSFSLVFVQALLTAGTGRLLGGLGGPLELRAALAWANAPLLGLLVVGPLRVADAAVPKLVTDVVSTMLLVWAEVLAVALVSEVHGLSVGRSLVAILLAWLVKIAVLVGLVLMLVGGEGKSSPIGSEPRQTTAIDR